VVVSGHGEGAVGLYWYLCSLMERWRGTEGFADSEDCAMLLARMRDLAAEDALPEVTIITPEATIIVPVYNNLLDTMLCLASVLEAGGPGFEIIVADDASSDGTAQVVAQIGGRVRHLRQGANLGFLRNCNVAATQARGRHVVLLNNDTLVLPGWLEALLAPFADARVGLVGAKLINWDGTLQEAGGIYWRDGSAWNFGRGGDVRAPQFNYLKEVDYCSGAAIALPRAVWQALGGFDEHYLPAYCEDADIAFRVRAAGLRCLYQPRAEVVHHEGRSHGRDVGTGIKAYQLANQAKLAERWAGELAGHYANAQNVFRARDRGFDRPHMLVIDHYVPKFDQDAGSRSVFSMIGALVDSGWAVTFWPDNLHEDPDYTPVLQAMGVEVMYGAALSGQFAAFWAERAGLYDAVLLSRPHVAERYLDVLRAGDARLIYYGHDLHHRRLAMQALVGGDGAPTPADIARVKAQEIAVARACHITLLPSEEEAAMLRAAAPGVLARGVPLCVVEPGVIARARSRPPRVADGVLRLLFVGGFGHQPNGDAVLWFAQAVAPVLRAGGHAFHLSIVGGGADAAVRALDGADMAVLGRVDDAALDALYDGVDVVIAPLRFGAGVKGKVVEAMARGVPVATTSVGAQGLAGASLFLGEDAQGFAEAVLRAADGGAAAQACLDYVERCFSQGAMAQVLNECAAREVIHAAA
jgi:GT2 family glycosyltransferase